MTAMRVRSGLTVQVLPDGDAVVARPDGSEAVIVNASAHAVIELLAQPHEPADVTRVFREAFPAQDAAVIERDVAALIAQLERAGILERCGSAPSTA